MSGYLDVYQTKRGRWRMCRWEAQALMSWRGSNMRRRVVRAADGAIVEFDSAEEAGRWAEKNLGRTPPSRNWRPTGRVST